VLPNGQMSVAGAAAGTTRPAAGAGWATSGGWGGSIGPQGPDGRRAAAGAACLGRLGRMCDAARR